jgi:hypothetical protein
VVNPGAIANNLKELNEAPADEELYPCIWFLDSLKEELKKKGAANIRNWLNSEWKRLQKSEHEHPFNDNSLQVHAPKGKQWHPSHSIHYCCSPCGNLK